MPKKDAITLLKEDHEHVRELLSELESSSERAAKKRERLLDEIEREVQIHTQIEEEIFYPAFRDAARKKDVRKIFFEAVEEHHVVDLVMPEIRDTDPGADEFAAKAKVLKDIIEHHMEEEENEMFPKAKKLLGRTELIELGEQLEERKLELKGEEE